MSSAWYSKKWVTVLLHITAWVFLFSFPFLLRPINDNRPASRGTVTTAMQLRYLLNNLIYIGLFYLNANVFISRFIYRRKYREYTAVIVASFIALLFFTWLILFRLLGHQGFNLRGHILFNFFFFLFILAASTAFRMIKDRAQADKIAREKENENLKTELSLLRSQASPHFMFNVLNNMVALARKKSDLMESSLIKFSSLMRYMLYEANEDKVSLEKEIEYLQSYIDLQQQRVGKNVKITTCFEKIEIGHTIEPMLLIPFVENAFKHGTGFVSITKAETSELILYNIAEINISLIVEKGILKFSVRNRYNEDSTETKDKTSGIGLSNVKRRLNLLYKNNHSLDIEKKDGWFNATLQLNLN